MLSVKGQAAFIRVFGYSFKDEGEWEILFDLFSEKENKLVSKHFAYYRSPTIEPIHRHSWYVVAFNDDPRYPLIETLDKIAALC